MDAKVINFLSDVVDSISELEFHVDNLGQEDFKTNRRIAKQARTTINTIIERMDQIPFGIKEKYPQVAWKDIEGLRDNIIFSQRFGDESAEEWNTAKFKLGQLKSLINKSFFA